MTIISVATSMAIIALVTGLIVFKILKVFLQVNSTNSVKQSLGLSGSTKRRHVIFVIIESGISLS